MAVSSPEAVKTLFELFVQFWVMLRLRGAEIVCAAEPLAMVMPDAAVMVRVLPVTPAARVMGVVALDPKVSPPIFREMEPRDAI